MKFTVPMTRKFRTPKLISEKTCRRCVVTFPLSAFTKQRKGQGGVTSVCIPCSHEIGKEYRAKNPGSRNEYKRKWRASKPGHEAANARRLRKESPERYRAHAAGWKKRNPEKAAAMEARRDPKKRIPQRREYTARNAAKIAAYAAARAKANPELYAAISANRRAKKLQATPPWADISAIANVYAEAAYMQMDVDHIVPLQSKFVCGLHVVDNLQLLTASENGSKGNRHWPDMP